MCYAQSACVPPIRVNEGGCIFWIFLQLCSAHTQTKHWHSCHKLRPQKKKKF